MNPSPKLPSFEGLRGIAAFMVVISHLRLTFWATSSADIGRQLSSLPDILSRPLLAVIEGLYNGLFAVWLFWVMSAFVLSLQFFLRVQQPPLSKAYDYLKDAGLRRYPRLLIPVFASVVFAYLLHAAHLMQNISLAHTLGGPSADWLASWYTFPANLCGALNCAIWKTFFAFDQGTTYNAVLWTMENELYGSLFLFAFLGLFGHRGSRFWIYPLLALAIHNQNIEWLNAFVFGIALCDLFVNQDRLSGLKQGWPWRLGLPLGRYVTGMFWIGLVAGVGLPNYGGVSYLVLSVAAVALTIFSPLTQRILTRAFPLFLGRISFGLYLIHFPLICSFSCWAYLATFERLGHTVAALVSSSATCVLSIVLAYLLYVGVDHPGIRISRIISSRILNAAKSPKD